MGDIAMKKIIILAAAGLVSFGVTFGVTWFLKDTEPVIPQVVEEPQVESETAGIAAGGGGMDFLPGGNKLSRGMTEKQLKSLIYDIREKMKEYRFREKELVEQEERIQTARDALQEDIDRLNGLHANLTATIGNLKQERDELERSTVEIAALEARNMQKLASTYDTMDSASSSKIMISMASHNQLQDAVKILYYMTDRTSGKLLAEITNSQPDLASVFSLQLKRIKESP